MISLKEGTKNTLKRLKIWTSMWKKYQENCRMETWRENWVWIWMSGTVQNHLTSILKNQMTLIWKSKSKQTNWIDQIVKVHHLYRVRRRHHLHHHPPGMAQKKIQIREKFLRKKLRLKSTESRKLSQKSHSKAQKILVLQNEVQQSDKVLSCRHDHWIQFHQIVIFP